jgi:hypothetical protein
MQPSGGPPPGWYKNPTGDGDRYWDGQRWTRQLRVPMPPPPAPSQPGGPEVAMPAVGGPPPGWFQNPVGRGDRYWDGEQWSERVRVLTASSAAASSPSSPRPPLGSNALAYQPLGPVPDRAVGQGGWRGTARVLLVAAVAGAIVVVGAAVAVALANRQPSGVDAGSTSSTTPASTGRADGLVGATSTTDHVVASSSAGVSPSTVTSPSTIAAAPSGSAPAVVNPGSFCSVEGERGQTTGGTEMVCASTDREGTPYAEGRLRWRKP